MELIYIKAFLWAFILLVGYYGLGRLVLDFTSFRSDEDYKWGRAIILGMGVTIIAGSVMMMLGGAIFVGLTTLSILGFLAGSYYIFLNFIKNPSIQFNRNQSKKQLNPDNNFLWLFIPFLFALLAFATSFYWPLQYDPNDDWIAYLTFPKIILQTGTLIEPFSARRILGLCGQSILLAQIMIVAEPESAHLLDRGFGALLLFGALMEATKGTPRQWTLLRSLVIFMAVTASVPRINTGISQIGIAFLICYFLALNTALANSKTRLLQLFPVTIILAGASSFRPTFAIYGGGVLIIYVLQSIFKNQGSCLKENIFLLLKVGLVTIAFLSPLMFLSWQSSGTPMFPFFKGNMAEEFIYMESGKGIWGDFIIVLNFMVMPEVLVMTIGMAVVFWAKPNDRTLGFSVIITTLIVVFLVSLNAAYTTGSWMMDLYRYAYPLYAIAFYWILAKCLENASKEKFSSSPSAILAGVMVAIFWSVHLVPASKEIQMELEFLLIQSTGFKFPTDSLRPFYDDLQNKVPPGEKIFAVVDAPYLLNYERNPISNVDVVAYASPTPGMPFHQGPEALRSYLLGLGYKYLLAVDFNKAVFLYNRKAMENHPRPEHRNHAKRYVLDFLNNVDALSEKSTIAKNDNARLISL